MSYLAHILQPDEKVLFDGHLHWIIYSRAILFALLAGLCGGALYFLGDQQGLKFSALSLAFILA